MPITQHITIECDTCADFLEVELPPAFIAHGYRIRAGDLALLTDAIYVNARLIDSVHGFRANDGKVICDVCRYAHNGG